MKTVLATKQVTKTYPVDDTTINAVDEVSIEIKAGESVALVGPRGSGKTTMLAMLAGLLNPTEGEVIIDGQDLSKMSEAERTQFRREKIGFTFQANNLVPFLTVLEHVELMMQLNGNYDKDAKQ
ncbi:MAG: ATP-binding cassette domain-containing protein, partial [Chloroflexi bacterium]